MLVSMLVASDEATLGSVIAETGADLAVEQRLQPMQSFCSAVPPGKRERISMLPTSGALQLKTSGAASDRAEDVSQRVRIFVVGKPRPFRSMAVEQIPPGPRRALAPSIASSGRAPPSAPGPLRASERSDELRCRIDMLGHEGLEPIAQRHDVRRQFRKTSRLPSAPAPRRRGLSSLPAARSSRA